MGGGRRENDHAWFPGFIATFSGINGVDYDYFILTKTVNIFSFQFNKGFVSHTQLKLLLLKSSVFTMVLNPLFNLCLHW